MEKEKKLFKNSFNSLDNIKIAWNDMTFDKRLLTAFKLECTGTVCVRWHMWLSLCFILGPSGFCEWQLLNDYCTFHPMHRPNSLIERIHTYVPHVWPLLAIWKRNRSNAHHQKPTNETKTTSKQFIYSDGIIVSKTQQNTIIISVFDQFSLLSFDCNRWPLNSRNIHFFFVLEGVHLDTATKIPKR